MIPATAIIIIRIDAIRNARNRCFFFDSCHSRKIVNGTNVSMINEKGKMGSNVILVVRVGLPQAF